MKCETCNDTGYYGDGEYAICDECGGESKSGQVDAIVMPRSMEEARKMNLSGWNIRCNYCGDYGARWIVGARPGWGSLCLCEKHEKKYDDEMRRHNKELKRLRTINYEQKRA